MTTNNINITNIPCDITANRILSRLNTRELCTFNRVSKMAQNILTYMASLPQEDIDFDGKSVFIHCNGTFTDFLRHRFKLEILAEDPTLSVYLQESKAKLIEEAKEKRDPKPDVGNLSQIFRDAPSTKKAFIALIDLPTKHLESEQLALALSNAFYFNSEIVSAILFCHPNAIHISGEGNGHYCETSKEHPFGPFLSAEYRASSTVFGEYGLGYLLQRALNTFRTKDADKLKFIKLLFSHRNGIKIPVLALQSVMSYTVRGGIRTQDNKWPGGNPEVLKAIFSHPNAINIPANGENSLASVLKDAKEIGNPDMIQVILSHPNAIHISSCTIF